MVQERVAESRQGNTSNILIFNSQRRYEARVLIDVLAGAAEPISSRKLLNEVRARVNNDQQDGLLPGYALTPTLLRATLGIMADLGVAEKRRNSWSLTSRGYEIIRSH